MKVTIENKYRFTFAKIEAYDSARCESTVRMIAHKNVRIEWISGTAIFLPNMDVNC